jgi:cbb3-type cytochrome oxidase maturation protein
MYYPYFIAYMAAGFIISLVVFFWALNSGQFKDQQRARFLPLQNDLQTQPVKMPRFARIQTYALLTLFCFCLASAAAVVIFSLMKGMQQ